MRVRKPVRSKTSAGPESTRRTAKPARPSTSEGFGSSFGPATIVLAIMAIVVIAVLIAGRDSSDPTAAYAQPSSAADSPAEAEKPAATPKKAATKPPKAEPANVVLAKDATKAPAAPPPAPPPTPPPATAPTVSSAVTIAGCLERTAEGFRLKDTSGEDAPTSRSWKFGFLKKGRAPVTVVDAVHALNLGGHVGQRVSVTGTIVDREMQVQSLRRVAAACK